MSASQPHSFTGRFLTLSAITLLGIAALPFLTGGCEDTYEVDITEYNDPEPLPGPTFEDDVLDDKNPEFDSELVDSRLLDGWEINSSAAVIELDCPMMKPDRHAKLLELRASYADAAGQAKFPEMLPSANLIDGANKQFDDGLYAALEIATFRGKIAGFPAVPLLVEEVSAKLPAGSRARPFLAAALSLTGNDVELTAAEQTARDKHLDLFNSLESRSKPISFYNWTPELQTIWKFYRFLQTELCRSGSDVKTELQIARDIASVLDADPKLRQSYQAATGFYMTLTNPAICLSMEDLIGAGEKSLSDLATETGVKRATIAFLPPSTSREVELFDSLFPRGLPSGANLMAEMISAVRSGKVDLSPGKTDGWYQHQVFALETLLLPSKGQEEQKLLLKKEYKKRLVEAFKALVTKRRETHVRQAASAGTDAAAAPRENLSIKPRLRVEPCATYYLRTARAYGFLQNFLATVADEATLANLRGLTANGNRSLPLGAELESVRLRAYGFYLISCEDIGMRADLADGELADPAAAKQLALDWLEKLSSNADLKQDTRVAVPIYFDGEARKTRIWVTLGVRLAKLDADYARPPQVRLAEGAEGEAENGEGQTEVKSGEDASAWQDVESHQLGTSHYVIAVDEFAEVTIPGLTCPDRKELRKLCDAKKTKEAIVKALEKGQWK